MGSADSPHLRKGAIFLPLAADADGGWAKMTDAEAAGGMKTIGGRRKPILTEYGIPHPAYLTRYSPIFVPFSRQYLTSMAPSAPIPNPLRVVYGAGGQAAETHGLGGRLRRNGTR